MLGAHNGDPRVFTGASIDISPADIAGVWENLGEQTVVVFDLFHVIMRVKFGVGPRPPLYPKITPPALFYRGWRRESQRDVTISRRSLSSLYFTAGRLSFPLHLVKKSAKLKLTSK